MPPSKSSLVVRAHATREGEREREREREREDNALDRLAKKQTK